MNDRKDTESLIDELSGRLTPVKPAPHPVQVISPWVIIAVAYLAGVVHFLGVRMDIADRLGEGAFLFEMVLTGAIAVSAAYCAGWMAIPDMRGQSWMMAVPVTLFGVFLLWTVCQMAESGLSIRDVSWHHCFSDAMLMGFVPIATLVMLVKRGATTRPCALAFMSVLSASALGWGALRITCMSESAGHILMLHFLPFVLAAALMGALARRLFRW